METDMPICPTCKQPITSLFMAKRSFFSGKYYHFDCLGLPRYIDDGDRKTTG